MYHKISSMCDKIRVIYDKSEQLRIMKYGHPDDPTHKKSDTDDIDFLIKDIQTLCKLLDQYPLDEKNFNWHSQ